MLNIMSGIVTPSEGRLTFDDMVKRVAEIDMELRALAPRLSEAANDIVQAEAAGFLDSADFRRGVAAVGARGLAYDVLILEHQLEEALRFCGAMSGQRLVLDHLAKPRIAAGELDRWAGLMRELGAMEHVTCKVSGMVTEADHGAWTYDQLTPYMDVAFEAFGPRRLLFGSDWPVCTLAAPYARVHEVFSRWRASLSMVGATVDAEAAVEAAYGLT